MVQVRRSAVIAAPVETVWRLIRDFNSHRDWHPAIAESVIESGRPGDAVGCVRRFALQEGAALREQLLGLDDRARIQTYCILDAPLPLFGYVASLRLFPITESDECFALWQGSFDCPEAETAALRRIVAGIYEGGLAALQARWPRRIGRGRVRVTQAAVEESQAPPPSGETAPSGAGMPGQAVVLRGRGGPEMLEARSLQAPPPGPGELRIGQRFVGLNYIDVYCRTGYFPLVDAGGVLGMEAAGEVIDVGPGVGGFAAGDRVAYAGLPPGAYRAIRTLPAELVVPLPEGVEMRLAAAALLKGMTAEFLLHRVQPLEEGMTVLIYAAAGGVGHLLCQWAAAKGARVLGVVGSEEKAGLARRSGAVEVLVGMADLPAKVMQLTGGKGAEVVFDAIGGSNLQRSFEALALQGHIVSYGQASGAIEPFDVAQLATKSAKLSRPNYGHYAGTAAEVGRMSRNLFAAMSRGLLNVHIGMELPLAEAAGAHRRLEGRQTQGCSILRV